MALAFLNIASSLGVASFVAILHEDCD